MSTVYDIGKDLDQADRRLARLEQALRNLEVGGGTPGDPGAPGSKWYSGTGAPAGATGIIGDWYLNDANGDVYEKTGASAWTLRDNLTGPQGPQGVKGDTGTTGTAGAPGSVWRSGAGAPAGALGIVGDWYLNTSNGDVYEKTGTTTYTLRDNLTGPQGAQGVPGEAWFSGSGAPSGTLTGSIINDWYLDTANGDVYEKTGTTTWTVRGNIRGPIGATGAAGSRWYSGTGAPAGATGVIADWYLNDSNGDVYEKTGATTWTLRDNLTGPTGTTGAPGSKWFTGAGVPAGTLAGTIVGDWYLNSSNGDYYEKTATTTWTLRGNIRGPTGAVGLTWRGAWASGTAYAVNDAVTYSGSSYRRLVAGTTATTPNADTTNWEVIAAAGGTGAMVTVRVRATRSSAYSLTGGAAASEVFLNSEDYDTHTMHDPASANNGRVIVTAGGGAGLYEIIGRCTHSQVSGYHETNLIVVRGGVASGIDIETDNQASTNGQITMMVQATLALAVGDYAYMTTYSSNTCNVQIVGTWLEMRRVGA